MYNVIMVCAGKDLENINITIESIIENLCFKYIFVITNEPEKVPKSDVVISIHENEIIPFELVEHIKTLKFPHNTSRFGWYLQQFLKMEFSRTSFCDQDYLIWDADTVVLKPLQFLNDGETLITLGNEKLHRPYLDTYKNLFGKEATLEKSVISQHLYVSRSIMLSMLSDLESIHNENAYKAILKNLSGSSPSLFSEYETYVNYAISQGASLRIIERKWFRNAASIFGFKTTYKKLKKFFNTFDYVALEKFDLTPLGRVKGLIKYLFILLKK